MNLFIILELILLLSSVELKHVPPKPVHQGNSKSSISQEEIAARVATWTPKDKNNAWELSGQFEGDIMVTEDSDGKNALQDDNARWDKAVIPYYIEKIDFSDEDRDIILGAFKEYHQKTCVKFRPYKKGDEDFITIQAKASGCWSFVGRKGGGQVVNLQNPGCVHHGIVVHELLHALGFYHQQSTYERDNFVTINWQNIKMGKEHNFRKYNEATVTNFGVRYDYGSIMHYSAYAFSKNGKPTITPLETGVEIGQREGLSMKDIEKLSRMYKCQQMHNEEEDNEYEDEDEDEYREDNLDEEKPDIEEEEEDFMIFPKTMRPNK
ncbi:hatching enzyme 1.2-like [Periplaneta americana]|uniref:hatching enzyme 1.2-like n=1 Tax=Periplaneta americana TaxID=6978 RepID=UPI0037E84794